MLSLEELNLLRCSSLCNSSVSLPLINKTFVVNNHIFWIINIFKFFIIRFVTIGNLIRVKRIFSLSSLGKSNWSGCSVIKSKVSIPFERVYETIVISNIVFCIININNLFVIRNISIGKFIAVWLSMLSQLVSLPFVLSNSLVSLPSAALYCRAGTEKSENCKLHYFDFKLIN